MAQIGTCQATLTSLVPNPTVGQTITYRIGSTIIAGPISLGVGNTTAPQIQALINADPVYQASGTTINVTSFTNQALTVTITKATSVKITSMASASYFETALVTSAFVCNLRRSKFGRGLPELIYIESIYLNTSQITSGSAILYKNVKYNFLYVQGSKYYFLRGDLTLSQIPYARAKGIYGLVIAT